LLNFEGVGTTLIAWVAFKEAIGGRAWAAMLAITLAGVLLSTSFTQSGWGFSPGALGIILACFLWGLDNNFTRNISDKDPLTIVAWKGLLAGTFSLFLGLFLGNQVPPVATIAIILLIGWVCYGLSTALFVRSMRGLGAARTSALYGTAPLAGVILSIFMFGEFPSLLFGLATILALGGAFLLVNENHTHFHTHAALKHDHRHNHADSDHTHDGHTGIHSGIHEHPAQEHEHGHVPDIHHRHGHDQ
jgi:drug/metabolite transporter (DMT)-like permease